MIILCGVRRYNAMGDLTLHGVSVCNDQLDEMFSCGLTCCLCLPGTWEANGDAGLGMIICVCYARR